MWTSAKVEPGVPELTLPRTLSAVVSEPVAGSPFGVPRGSVGTRPGCRVEP